MPRLPSPVASGRRVAVAVRAVGEDGEGSRSVGQIVVVQFFFGIGKIKEHET